MREAQDLADKCEEAEPINEKLHEIYEELTSFVGKDPPPDEGEEPKEKAEKELKYLFSNLQIFQTFP